MRTVACTIALLLLAAGGYAAAGKVRAIRSRAGADPALVALAGESRVGIAYELDRTRWTTFPIETAAGRPVKVASNASLPFELRQPQLSAGRQWHYAIDYEVLDRGGAVLLRHTYHHRAGLTWYRDSAHASPYTASFFLAPRLQPADGRTMMVNLTGLDDPAEIRLRLADADPEVRDVVARVYAEHANPEHKLGYLWRRLSESQRTQAAIGNVYPKELLSEAEQQAIVARTWNAVGPAGVQGEDYRPRELYALLENEGEPLPTDDAGAQAAPQRRSVIPIPEGGGQVVLRFAPPAGAGPQRGEIEVRWFGRGPAQRFATSLPWRGEPSSFSHELGAGLVEVAASSPVLVKAYLAVNGQETDITPAPFLIRAYRVDGDGPLELRVEHDGSLPTPLRIDLRRLAPDGGAPGGPAEVAWQLVDRAGREVRAGRQTLPFVPSPYDAIATAQPAWTVSEPESMHFLVPPEACAIRLAASSPVLAAAYSRPADLVREVRVPDDYLLSYSNEEKQPAWYMLLHPEHARLVTANRTVLLEAQVRPPLDVPDLLAGRYAWDEYRPSGRWLAHRLLVPVEGERPFRREALPAVFRPLRNGRETPIDLGGAPGLRQVEPTLLFRREGGDPLPVTVSLDGVEVHRRTVVGRAGEIRLPPVGAGRHRVLVSAPGSASFGINHAGPAPGALSLRLAHRLDGGVLRFVYEKRSAEEVLSARFFAPPGTGSVTIAVSLPDLRRDVRVPWSAWTFQTRRYTLRMDPGGTILDLDREGEPLAAAEPFFIPLGSDLPPGRYTIRIATASRSGFLQLSRTTPGLQPHRDVLNEGEEVRARAMVE